VRAGQAHHGDHLQQNFMHGFSGEQCMHGLMTSMDSLANSANNCMHGLFSVKLFRCICGQSDIFFLLLDHIVATCYSKCVASANFILLVDSSVQLEANPEHSNAGDWWHRIIWAVWS
jgi:hypothetical protein